MNFKNIQKYSNYQSYQRIKRIKHQQCNRGMTKSKCGHKSYQDYLDKKNGFICCPTDNKTRTCMYTGILGKTPCLTATLNAIKLDYGRIGFDSQGHGSLLPAVSWDGFTVESFKFSPYTSIIPDEQQLGAFQLIISGSYLPVFQCIELIQNNKKIRLFMPDYPTSGCLPDIIDDDPTKHYFCWPRDMVEPSNANLTTGTWTFRLCLTC